VRGCPWRPLPPFGCDIIPRMPRIIATYPETWINWVRTPKGTDIPLGGSTNSTSAVVDFGGTEGLPATEGTPLVRIDLKIDNGEYTPVTSPHTITGLSVGPHTIYLRAQSQGTENDTADPSPANWTFTVNKANDKEPEPWVVCTLELRANFAVLISAGLCVRIVWTTWAEPDKKSLTDLIKLRAQKTLFLHASLIALVVSLALYVSLLLVGYSTGHRSAIRFVGVHKGPTGNSCIPWEFQKGRSIAIYRRHLSMTGSFCRSGTRTIWHWNLGSCMIG
jgi:hypothetical protein